MSSAALLLQKIEELKLLAQNTAEPIADNYDLLLPAGLVVINSYFLVYRIVQQITPSKYALVVPVIQCLMGLALIAITKSEPAGLVQTILSAVALFCAAMSVAGSLTLLYRLRVLRIAIEPKNKAK